MLPEYNQDKQTANENENKKNNLKIFALVKVQSMHLLIKK